MCFGTNLLDQHVEGALKCQQDCLSTMTTIRGTPRIATVETITRDTCGREWSIGSLVQFTRNVRPQESSIDLKVTQPIDEVGLGVPSQTI